ncbi:MAG: hypothetical protein WDZ31_14495 [Phycisphaeraceae bacterium]
MWHPATGTGKESVIRRIQQVMLLGCASLAALTGVLWLMSWQRSVIMVIPLPGEDPNQYQITVIHLSGRVVMWVDWNTPPAYRQLLQERDGLHKAGVRLIEPSRIRDLRWKREEPDRFMGGMHETRIFRAAGQGHPSFFAAHHFNVSPPQPNPFPFGFPASGNWRSWELIVPHAVLLAVLMVPPAVIGWRRLHRRLRFNAGCCTTCGYDLRGNQRAAACPECGSATKVE